MVVRYFTEIEPNIFFLVYSYYKVFVSSTPSSSIYFIQCFFWYIDVPSHPLTV